MPILIEKCSVTMRTCLASEWPAVSAYWRELVEAADASFFLSEPWIETWLEVFGAEVDTRFLIFENGSTVVGIAMLTASRRGLLVLPIRRLSLNATGEGPADTTYLEYNTLLCRPGYEAEVIEGLLSHLKELQWDEFALDGVVDGPLLESCRHFFSQLDCEESRHPSYFVDLAALRQSGEKYETVLKSSHRKHLRQNIRYYSELGPLALTVAANVEEALALLEEMGDLSNRRAETLQRRSVFSSPRFRQFHRQLIRRCHPTGNVQLMRLSVGGQTVGVLYNLMQKGRVYFYQCGYEYGGDKRLSPGTVTLAHAIQYLLESGADDYDFLSGDSKYKQWMSTGSRNLSWCVWRRDSLRNDIWSGIRRLQRKLVARQEQA